MGKWIGGTLLCAGVGALIGLVASGGNPVVAAYAAKIGAKVGATGGLA